MQQGHNKIKVLFAACLLALLANGRELPANDSEIKDKLVLKHNQPELPPAIDVNVPGTVMTRPKTLASFRVNNPEKRVLTVVCQTPETKFLWFREYSDDERVARYVVFANEEGEYRLTFLVAQENRAVIVGETRIVVSSDGQPVEPIVPPKPKDDAPIPAQGLHVLVVYESATLTRLPGTQQAVLFGKQIRDYLNTHCPLGPDNKTRQWRMWDKDVDATGEQQLWQNALKRANEKIANWQGTEPALPWVIISNGQTGYEGPLPRTVEEMIRLLDQYRLKK